MLSLCAQVTEHVYVKWKSLRGLDQAYHWALVKHDRLHRVWMQRFPDEKAWTAAKARADAAISIEADDSLRSLRYLQAAHEGKSRKSLLIKAENPAILRGQPSSALLNRYKLKFDSEREAVSWLQLLQRAASHEDSQAEHVDMGQLRSKVLSRVGQAYRQQHLDLISTVPHNLELHDRMSVLLVARLNMVYVFPWIERQRLPILNWALPRSMSQAMAQRFASSFDPIVERKLGRLLERCEQVIAPAVAMVQRLLDRAIELIVERVAAFAEQMHHDHPPSTTTPVLAGHAAGSSSAEVDEPSKKAKVKAWLGSTLRESCERHRTTVNGDYSTMVTDAAVSVVLIYLRRRDAAPQGAATAHAVPSHPSDVHAAKASAHSSTVLDESDEDSKTADSAHRLHSPTVTPPLSPRILHLVLEQALAVQLEQCEPARMSHAELVGVVEQVKAALNHSRGTK